MKIDPKMSCIQMGWKFAHARPSLKELNNEDNMPIQQHM
jgi:hypothetical protein